LNPTPDQQLHLRAFLRTLPSYALNFIAHTLMSILFARWMGVKHYGSFVFAFHAIRIAADFAGMGMRQAAMKFLPKYLKRGESQLFRGFYRTGLFVNTALGLLLGYLAFVVMLPVVEGSHSHFTLQHAWWICPLLGLNIFLSVVLRAKGHSVWASATQGSIRNFLAIIIAYILVHDYVSLNSEVVIIIFAMAIALCIVVQLIVQMIVIPGEMGRHLPMYKFREWASTSFTMWFSSLSESLITIGGIVLLRLLSDEDAVAYYHAAWILASIIMTPGKAVLAVIQPVASREYPDNQRAYKEAVKAGGKLLLYSMAPLCLILLIGGYYFLGWFGHDFNRAYGLLPIVVFARTGHVVALFMSMQLNLSGLEKYVARVSYITSISAILLMIGLISRINAYGMAVSYLAASLSMIVIFDFKIKYIKQNP